MNVDHSNAPEGATHYSAGGKFDDDIDRLPAYWRPDGSGTYECWALTQIAAEEREKSIMAMVDSLGANSNTIGQFYQWCSILHDAGYRKQVQP